MTQYSNYFVAKEAAATMDRFAIKQTEEAQICIVVFRMFLNMTDHRICTDIPDFQIIGVGNFGIIRAAEPPELGFCTPILPDLKEVAGIYS